MRFIAIKFVRSERDKEKKHIRIFIKGTSQSSKQRKAEVLGTLVVATDNVSALYPNSNCGESTDPGGSFNFFLKNWFFSRVPTTEQTQIFERFYSCRCGRDL